MQLQFWLPILAVSRIIPNSQCWPCHHRANWSPISNDVTYWRPRPLYHHSHRSWRWRSHIITFIGNRYHLWIILWNWALWRWIWSRISAVVNRISNWCGRDWRRQVKMPAWENNFVDMILLLLTCVNTNFSNIFLLYLGVVLITTRHAICLEIHHIPIKQSVRGANVFQSTYRVGK